MLEGLGADEAHGGPEHAGDLGIVAARMGGACLRIGDRMPGHDQRVQLSQQREGGPVLLASRFAAHARDGEPALGLEPDLAHGVLDQARGLELLEPQLGVLANRVADRDDLLALAVDGLADCALHVIACGHGGSCRVVDRGGRA